MNDPFIACLCPTYGRPELLENAIACFEAQDYPPDLRYLIVLDDAGQLEPQRGDRWEVISRSERFPSLPAKYRELADLSRDRGRPAGYADITDCAGISVNSFPTHGPPDVLAIWEDDDLYLPWYLSAHAEALAGLWWAHPGRVWSTYGDLQTEPAAGRFFASTAVRLDMFDLLGGFVQTDRADFDQQFLARMARAGRAGDPAEHDKGPSYVFRWGDTNAPHGQGYMRDPGDVEWYDRYATENAKPRPLERPLRPALSDKARQTMAAIAEAVAAGDLR